MLNICTFEACISVLKNGLLVGTIWLNFLRKCVVRVADFHNITSSVNYPMLGEMKKNEKKRKKKKKKEKKKSMYYI